MTPENHQKSELTLSAVPELDRGADRSPTERPVAALRGSTGRSEPSSVIRAELRRISVARRRNAKSTARRRLDRLIDYVWGDVA